MFSLVVRRLLTDLVHEAPQASPKTLLTWTKWYSITLKRAHDSRKIHLTSTPNETTEKPKHKECFQHKAKKWLTCQSWHRVHHDTWWWVKSVIAPLSNSLDTRSSQSSLCKWQRIALTDCLAHLSIMALSPSWHVAVKAIKSLRHEKSSLSNVQVCCVLLDFTLRLLSELLGAWFLVSAGFKSWLNCATQIWMVLTVSTWDGEIWSDPMMTSKQSSFRAA